MSELIAGVQAFGQLFWNLLGIAIVGYIAYKVVPVAGEAGEAARDRLALVRAEVRLLADAGGFDLDAMRVKRAERERKTFQNKLEEMKQLRKEVDEIKKAKEKEK